MTLRRTPFFASHMAAGARLIDFGGWEMPIQYAGILAEHQGVRSSAGLFDVSHMGEVRVQGAGAVAALNQLLCNDVRKVSIGQSQYSAILNDSGGFVDDVFVYRLGEEDLLVCVNASNQEKDFQWLLERNPFPGEAEVRNESEDWAQIAVQGRAAAGIVDALTDCAATEMERGAILPGSFAGVEGCLLARTGYTGEDGFEIFLPAQEASPAWDRVMSAGGEQLVPVGLGARDTLRLEVGNVLYGNDIDGTTTPLEAGLRWITAMDKPDFIGRSALLKQKEEGITRRLVGLEVEKRIGRPHQPIHNSVQQVGELTSGTRSPTLGTNIALGYVARGNGRPGTRLQVDVRGRMADATVVRTPFYKRDY